MRFKKISNNRKDEKLMFNLTLQPDMFYFILCTFCKWILSTQKHNLYELGRKYGICFANLLFLLKSKWKTVKLAFLNHLYFILFLQLASSRFSCTEFVFATFSYSVVLSGEAINDVCGYIVSTSALFWFHISLEHLFVCFWLALNTITAFEIIFLFLYL